MKGENMPRYHQRLPPVGETVSSFPPLPCTVLHKLSEKCIYTGDQWKTKKQISNSLMIYSTLL